MQRLNTFLGTMSGTIAAIMIIGGALVASVHFIMQSQLAPIESKIDIISQDTYREFINASYKSLITGDDLCFHDMELALIYCYNYTEVFDGNSETKHKCEYIKEKNKTN